MKYVNIRLTDFRSRPTAVGVHQALSEGRVLRLTRRGRPVCLVMAAVDPRAAQAAKRAAVYEANEAHGLMPDMIADVVAGEPAIISRRGQRWAILLRASDVDWRAEAASPVAFPTVPATRSDAGRTRNASLRLADLATLDKLTRSDVPAVPLKRAARRRATPGHPVFIPASGRDLDRLTRLAEAAAWVAMGVGVGFAAFMALG